MKSFECSAPVLPPPPLSWLNLTVVPWLNAGSVKSASPATSFKLLRANARTAEHAADFVLGDEREDMKTVLLRCEFFSAIGQRSARRGTRGLAKLGVRASTGL